MGAVPLVLGGIKPGSILVVWLCLAAAVALSVRHGWRRLMIACTLISAPQALVLIGSEEGGTAAGWAALCGFTSLYAFAGFGPGLVPSATRLAWPWVPAGGAFAAVGILLIGKGAVDAEIAGVGISCAGAAFIALVLIRPLMAQREPTGAVRDVVRAFWATGLALVAAGLSIWLAAQLA